ncbi:MAG: amino acid adenylation domain-containing protein [Gammaproteobacteria bacterium]
MKFLYRAFEAHARQQPERAAVSGPGGALTYGALEAQANRVARGLIARGVSPGDLVGLCLDWTPDFLVALLGVWKAGAAYLPLDPVLPAARLEAIIAQASPQLILLAPHWRGAFNMGRTPTAVIPEVVEQQSAQPLDLECQPEQLAYVMYTSGTQGSPKGVMVTHGNIAGLFTAFEQRCAFSASDVWSLSHSYGFGYSVWEIWGALSHGGCLVPVPVALRGDPARLQGLFASEAVTVLSQTPSAFQQTLLSSAFELSALPALRLIALSGEALPPIAIQRWFDRDDRGGCLLLNTYAVTETAGQVTARFYDPDNAFNEDQHSVGMPLPQVQLQLRDDAGLPVADGEIGELYVGGPGVAQGYLHEPQLTAEKFVQLAGMEQEQRFYRTGDRARRATDGSIIFAGRDDNQLKWRGHRLEAGEVEQVLLSHPDVGETAVAISGDGDAARLVAYYTLGELSSDTEAEFWPSIGPYQVYDEFLYDLMGTDSQRLDSFRQAYARSAPGRVVLDLGTGEHALLARLCVEAGARHVYAVEVLPEVAAKARETVARLGLSERITVIDGDVSDVDLPERIELSTQGIIGNIGSADGIIPIWNAARAQFAPDCIPVPSRCRTLIAPAELPELLATRPVFSRLARDYAERVFAQQGGEFDIRLCVRNFPADGVLAEPAEFEDLDFSAALTPASTGEAGFTVARAGRLDGFLLWTVIETDGEPVVDYLQQQQAWLPAFFPLPDGPVDLVAGEQLRVHWERVVAGLCPDYRLEIAVQGAVQVYTSCYQEAALNETHLHRRLLSAPARPGNSPDALREWLAERLPAYMLPTAWVRLPAMPLTVNGKLDRGALPAPGRSRPQLAAPAVLPRDELEAELVEIWSAALDLESVGIADNFFDLGGDSIAAVRLTSAVQTAMDASISLAALFDAPTVGELADWLREQGKLAVKPSLSIEEGTL